MKIWNIGTPDGEISVSTNWFVKLEITRISNYGDQMFVYTKDCIFSTNTNDWKEIQQELREVKIGKILE